MVVRVTPAPYRSLAIPRPSRPAPMRLVAGSLPGASQPDPEFTIVSEDVKYARYLTLYSRAVRFPPTPDAPAGPVHEFDVAGHPRSAFHFCVTFPFHPAPSGDWRDGEVTLVREYAQGPNALAYCLPTGAFDPRKHADLEACARAELSEEAHLKGGRLEGLLPAGVGVPEVKWCANRFTPFMVWDPEADEAPGARDTEEFIAIVRVTVPELRALMRSGEMLLPSVTTCWWAMERLEEMQAEGKRPQ